MNNTFMDLKVRLRFPIEKAVGFHAHFLLSQEEIIFYLSLHEAWKRYKMKKVKVSISWAAFSYS